MKQKKIVSVLILLAAVFIGVMSYWIFAKPGIFVVNQSTPIPDETADWQVYRNDKYAFEIKYPPSSREAVFNIFKIFDPYNLPVDTDKQFRGPYEALSIVEKFQQGLIEVQNSVSYDDFSMPSTSKLVISILDKNIGVSLSDWVMDTELAKSYEGKYKIERIGDYDVLIFGAYPYSAYLTSKNKLEPVIFLVARDGKKVAGFHLYPYIESWDKIISTFRFIQ